MPGSVAVFAAWKMAGANLTGARGSAPASRHSRTRSAAAASKKSRLYQSSLRLLLPPPPHLWQPLERLIVHRMVPRGEPFVVNGRVVGAECQQGQEGVGVAARGHVQSGAAIPAPQLQIGAQGDQGFDDCGIPVVTRCEVQRRQLHRVRDVRNRGLGRKRADALDRDRIRAGWPSRVHIRTCPDQRGHHRRIPVVGRGCLQGRDAVHPVAHAHIPLGVASHRLQVCAGFEQ